MSTLKTEKNYREDILGFPVIIDEVAVDTRHDIAMIDYEALSLRALAILATIERRLTGSEVRFIRGYFGLTLQAFASRLGCTHAAVMKWEERGALHTKMAWSTEKDIRLLVLAGLGVAADVFLEHYARLAQGAGYEVVDEPPPMRIHAHAVARQKPRRRAEGMRAEVRRKVAGT